ncbi:MAG: energy-dependent translational throttle protein EttA [Desulfuromonadales bacterium]|nr:energy-dependent translational throttle protein EttA [Desulfuromonadales bacterium]
MITTSKITMRFGKTALFEDVSVKFVPGNRYGLIGANGSGKSTFMKILTGQLDQTEGQVSLGHGCTLGYLRQDHSAFDEQSIIDTVYTGSPKLWKLHCEREYLYSKDELTDEENDRCGHIEEEFGDAGGYTMEAEAATLLVGLGFTEDLFEQKMTVLQGGFKLRVLLAQVLFGQPDILLLDEPTNHLDAESVAWLEQHLQRYAGTIIAVTHDRYFLDNVAGWILELDRGQGIPWKGNYSSWLEQKQDRLRQEEKVESSRQRTLQRELEWIHMSPKGRHAKGQARINAYEKLLGQESEKQARDLELYIPPGPRLGNLVIESRGVTKGYGDRLLFENLDFALPPGGIVGVIGPNGAGKTTLFRLITGQEQTDDGDFKVGDTVSLAYVDQGRELDPNKSIYEEITSDQEQIQLGTQLVNSRAYVARFNFSGSDQQKRVSMLSGGERNRVHLAKMLKEGANVILLDEPTNDLDVNTMRALEEALENFAGCAVVISHDRWFLDRIATHILAFEGDSRATFFEGNWSEYEADRKKRLGAEADRPHRIKYRQLTR